MDATILLGYQEAIRRRLHGFRRWAAARTIPERPVWPFSSSFRHTPPVVMTHPTVPQSYAGAGLGRSPSISRRISWNNSLGTATSAIWNVTYRACVTILAPIFTSFSLRLVSDQCATASGNARLLLGAVATNFPYLTTVEGLKLAAQAFSKDVKMLSCCAGKRRKVAPV